MIKASSVPLIGLQHYSASEDIYFKLCMSFIIIISQDGEHIHIKLKMFFKF